MQKILSRALCITVVAVLMGAATSSVAAAAGDAAVTQLKIIDKKIGEGEKATPGERVTVDYTGWLYDADAKDHRGKEFDSSRDHGQPFSFELGFGQVIDGWDRGIAGMRVGGERVLIIPADLAYGAKGSGRSIPPNAPLVFDVTLKDVLQ